MYVSYFVTSHLSEKFLAISLNTKLWKRNNIIVYSMYIYVYSMYTMYIVYSIVYSMYGQMNQYTCETEKNGKIQVSTVTAVYGHCANKPRFYTQLRII
jgi:hypothetical protein